MNFKYFWRSISLLPHLSIRIGLLLFLLGGAANAAFADTIKVEFSGTVTSLSGRLVDTAEKAGGLVSSFINIGDTINYSFTFEETLADGSDSTNSYPAAISAFSGSVGNYNFSGISGLAVITNDGGSKCRTPPCPIFDGLGFSFSAFTNTDGNADRDTSNTSIIIGDLSPLSLISLSLQSDTTLISNTDLVEENISSAFSDPSLVPFFMDFSGGLVINGTFNSATISAVPIPAAVWLFGSGLGLLGWMKRKKA